MGEWTRRLFAGGTAMVAVGAMSLFVGCSDDLYQPCQLDPSSPDEAISACGQNDGSLARSCVVDNQIQCDTRTCGRYEGSSPFCTKVCTDDGDCPSGTCVEFVFQSGRKYCVQDELL